MSKSRSVCHVRLDDRWSFLIPQIAYFLQIALYIVLSARIALFARAYYSYMENKLICNDSLICELPNKPILANKLIWSDVSDKSQCD